jgi:hypothetical protein
MYLTKQYITHNNQSIFMNLYITFTDIFLFYAQLLWRDSAYLFSVTEEKSNE